VKVTAAFHKDIQKMGITLVAGSTSNAAAKRRCHLLNATGGECDIAGRFFRDLDFEFAGLVLKPGDIQTIQPQPKTRGEWQKTAAGRLELDLGDEPVFKKEEKISACLELVLTTPYEYVPDIRIPVSQTILMSIDDAWGGDKLNTAKKIPQVVYRSWGVSFGFSSNK
jgi:hypothetical protein